MDLKKKIIIISLCSVIAVLAVLTGVSVWAVSDFKSSLKIASNVTFEDVYIGDLTKEEATELLKEKEYAISKPVVVTYEDKQFEIVPKATGIEYDYEKIVDEAYKKGREKSFFGNLFDIIASRLTFSKINPEYAYNEEIFKDTLGTLASVNGIKFNNIEVEVNNSSASVKLDKNIYDIDYEKLHTDIMGIIEKEDDRKVEISKTATEHVTAQMIYDLIYIAPQNASVRVENGITMITPHVVGVDVSVDEIQKYLDEGRESFDVSVKKVYPDIRVEHLSGNLFADTLGTWTTKFNSGVVGRSKNVALAAQKINGVILNSGDTFSYNNTVGPRTAAAGFSNATVYTASGMEDGIGGGICQVSSTLYNAVLYADLKIVERRNHSYTVSYVNRGLDATVSYGLIDFKFQNNKNSPIKVVASVDGGTLTVSVLGKKDNDYTVELSSSTIESYAIPEQQVEDATLEPGTTKVIQNGSYGYKVVSTKTVKDSAGNVVRQESLGTSVYKPMTKIVHVGPSVTITPVPEVDSGINPEENQGEVTLPEQQPVQPEPTQPSYTEPVPDITSPAPSEVPSQMTTGIPVNTPAEVPETPPVEEMAPPVTDTGADNSVPDDNNSQA